MTNPPTNTARLLDFRKESDMKVTALYERLSKGDERQSNGEDSNSIQNQKAQLEEYAKREYYERTKYKKRAERSAQKAKLFDESYTLGKHALAAKTAT